MLKLEKQFGNQAVLLIYSAFSMAFKIDSKKLKHLYYET